jgi:hypothetical protein
MVSNQQRTAAEQKFWDAAFLAAWADCVKQHEIKGSMYCSSLARDAADAALIQRRNSARGVQ